MEKRVIMTLSTSSISKGHFNDVAAIFKHVGGDIENWANAEFRTVGENLMLRMATHLASLYGTANPYFDRTRFLKACNPNPSQRRGGSVGAALPRGKMRRARTKPAIEAL